VHARWAVTSSATNPTLLRSADMTTTGTAAEREKTARPYGTTGLDRRIGVVEDTRKVAEPP
jgi:hypothetical protein